MHFNGVEIPESLLRASASGDLVVFAGAGVSRQEPVCLPLFDELVERIKACSSNGHNLRERLYDSTRDGGIGGYAEPPEKYLGYLENAGCDIRPACAELLSADGETTQLHSSLLKLFNARGTIRIVTTNFDNCFEVAMSDAEIRCARYAGPALPLGDQISGLIHLHGSVDQPADMVLTAKDYGRAYVTEGWASRFLVKLFSKYHVLFIGYSCSDLLVDYLTRSISDDMMGKAYVLSEASANANEWEDRGVEVIRYQGHEALPKVIGEWASYLTQSLTDRVIRMREVAAKEDLSEIEREFLLESLFGSDSSDRVVLAREFSRVSNSFQHLILLRQEGHCGFLQKEELDEAERILFYWSISRFAVSAWREFQGFCFPMRENLSWRFYYELCETLAFSDASDEAVGSWMAWIELSGQSSAKLNVRALIGLAEETGNPEIAFSAIRVLLKADYDLQLRVLLGNSPQASLSLCDSYWKERVVNLVKKWTASIGDRLFDYCVQQIEFGYSIRTNCWTGESSFDGIAFSRSSVAPHEQDRNRTSAEGILLDVARECVHEPYLERMRDRCLQSRCALVVRLGLWIQVQLDREGNSLALIIDRNFLDDLFLHHEVFQLIETAYKNANDATRSAFVGYLRDRWDPENHGSSYSCFNVCVWILLAVEDDPMASDLMGEILGVWPDFVPRQHPDLTHYMSSGFVNVGHEYEITENQFSVETMIERLYSGGESQWGIDAYDIVEYPTRAYPTKAVQILKELGAGDIESEELSICNLMLPSVRWADPRIDANEAFETLCVLLGRPSTCSAALRSLANSCLCQSDKKDWGIKQLGHMLQIAIINIDAIVHDEFEVLPGIEIDWAEVASTHVIGRYIKLVALLLEKQVEDERLDVGALGALLSPLLSFTEDNDDPANIIIAGLAMELNLFAKYLPDMAERVAMFFAPEGGGRRPAWDGLAYSGCLTEEAWILIGEHWKALFQKGYISDTRNYDQLVASYICTLLMLAINPDKRECFLACMMSSPQACKTAYTQIDFWLNALPESERLRSWESLILNISHILFESNDEKRDVVTEMYARWLGEYPELRKSIIAELCPVSNDSFGKMLFIPEGVLQSIAEDCDLVVGEKATAISFLLNRQRHICNEEEVLRVAELVDASALSPSEMRVLEDAYTRAGMPGVFR